MLVVRTEQMEILAAATRAGYERRVIAYLRAETGALAHGHSDADLRDLIGEAMELGERHDMTSEQDVLWLVLFRLSLGPGFEDSPEYPWIAGILADPDMPGGVKALQIRTRLADAAAQEAEEAHLG